jgi:hypothetical protein
VAGSVAAGSAGSFPDGSVLTTGSIDTGAWTSVAAGGGASAGGGGVTISGAGAASIAWAFSGVKVRATAAISRLAL